MTGMLTISAITLDFAGAVAASSTHQPPLAIRLYLGGECELLTIVWLHRLFAVNVFPLFRRPGEKRPRGS
jgi:hypothetical protein